MDSSITSELDTRLTLTVKRGLVRFFNTLLQSGFRVRASAGASIETFLRERLGLDEEYVQNRIQTVFMNNKAVDNPASAAITENAGLALSAALPGLVGATLRKGGYYAAMREGISHGAETGKSSGGDTWVRVKLFNLVAKDLGAVLLERGIYLESGLLDDFLKQQSPDFWAGCREVELNRRPLSVEDLKNVSWQDRNGLVFLTVRQQD